MASRHPPHCPWTLRVAFRVPMKWIAKPFALQWISTPRNRVTAVQSSDMNCRYTESTQCLSSGETSALNTWKLPWWFLQSLASSLRYKSDCFFQKVFFMSISSLKAHTKSVSLKSSIDGDHDTFLSKTLSTKTHFNIPCTLGRKGGSLCWQSAVLCVWIDQ